ASVLNRSAQVYEGRLVNQYNAGSGIEAVLWDVLSDPTFDDDLTPDEPDKTVEIEANDEIITVSVTKQFTSAEVEGQAIIVTKDVSPATAPMDTQTTFTYTIKLKNEGTDEAEVRRVYDYLPPGFNYVNGSTSGITTSNPSTGSDLPFNAICGSVPKNLEWNVQPNNVVIGPAEQKTLTFQATGTLSDGVYYNQAGARYTPWWDSNDVYVYSPHEAAITGGTGDAQCGYGLKVLITSEVTPAVPEPGVEQDFTYTINVENVSPGTVYVCGIEDVLPPGFVYKYGSASSVPESIYPEEPDETWMSAATRWELEWEDGGRPLATLSAGEIRTQVFQGTATPESGVNYFNEFGVEWATGLLGNGSCKPGNTAGFVQGGAGQASSVDSPIIYDISSVASDGTILSRVVYYESAGEIEILSWQEY
ncbi:MAG: hypothetical protein WD645_01940, partial [Dehalococcoidia bacterium]